MARYQGINKFVEKELREIYLEWAGKADILGMLSYRFALQMLAPDNTKNAELAVGIAAVAYSKLMNKPFNEEWHTKLQEECIEGYEAGFYAIDILAFADCEVRTADIYELMDMCKGSFENVVPTACSKAVFAYNKSWESLTVFEVHKKTEFELIDADNAQWGQPRYYKCGKRKALINEATKEFCFIYSY